MSLSESDLSSKTTNNYKLIVYFICLVAALGGLLFGLDQGFIANSLDTISSVYNLDLADSGEYSAILATGGVFGALLSGVFARVLGRKRSLILAGFIFSAGSIFSALLPALPILSACRFLLGFAVGISSFVVPLYLSETAPATIRGSMGTLFQLMITIGILLVSVSNVFIVKLITNPNNALQLMFLVVAAFSVLLLVGSLVIPESPRWLMLKGKKEQAIRNLNKILSTRAAVESEIKAIEQTLADSKETGVNITLKSYFIKVLFIGILLQMFQQLVGINVMIYYAPTIFGYAGITGLTAMLTVPIVNMFFTLPAVSLVEKWGRKNLLYVGALFMLAAMITAGLAFQSIEKITDPALTASLPKTMLLISIIIYIFGFAVSWGPVAWIICSEIFPLKGRELGMTITTMVNWTFAGILMRYSLSFMESFGKPLLFYLFAGFCVLAIIFVAFFVPETKGVTLEELESRLKK